MRNSEFKKAIKELSDKYDVEYHNVPFSGSQTIIMYKLHACMVVSEHEQFDMTVLNEGYEFERLPYSHKLWMLAAELAMTPLKKRKDEKKYNIIVGTTNNDFDGLPELYYHDGGFMGVSVLLPFESINNPQYLFTESQIDTLKKSLLMQQDGDALAKIVDIGKREVKP